MRGSPPGAAPSRPGRHHGLLGRCTYLNLSIYAHMSTHCSAWSPHRHAATARRVHEHATNRASSARPPPGTACAAVFRWHMGVCSGGEGSSDEHMTNRAPERCGDSSCRHARQRGMSEHGIMLGMGCRATGRCGKHLRARYRRLHHQRVDHAPPLTLLQRRVPAPGDLGYLLPLDALESSDSNWIRL